MREIVLDTETTGLDPEEGHRIVEIGAVELINGLPTGAVWHQYVNPERPMPQEAFQIHGLGDDFLRDKPVFSAVAAAFLAFIAEAPLVIHNAAFDMKMINAELERLGQAPLPMARAVDTLDIARRRFPGAQVNLDALCRRFGVDNSGREKHGALLDCELLAEVYLELQGGRQAGLSLSPASAVRRAGPGTPERPLERPRPLPPRLTAEERAAHEAFVAEIGAHALWHDRGPGGDA